ncbi:MAG: serine O-acetyltransferase EpsC [Pseudomonadota bacterium]
MKNLRADVERYRLFLGDTKPVSTLGLIATCLNPRMTPVGIIRMAEFFFERRLFLLAKFCSMLNIFFFGIEASPRVKIGGGLFLPHTVGTVIGAETIGRNATILQGVTLGTAEPDSGFDALLRPVVGDHVTIGAGAKVIGRVVVGDHSTIGANAVVLQDVPAHALAVGVPARIIYRAAPTIQE